MKDIKNTLILSGTILLVSIAFAFVFFNRAKADDVVTVSGLGKVDFQSDLIAWKGEFTQSDRTLEGAYAKLKKNTALVKAYLAKAGIQDSEITFQAVNINKIFSELYQDGKKIGEELSGYSLTQDLKVESKEVDKVEKVSRSITELIDQGVEFTSKAPDYFYTALGDLKLQLLATATKDAQQRAQQVALNAGGALGKLRYANMGVFQIVETNSSDEASWDGAFNTKAKKKTANLTVKVQYELK